jgi:hypothetical protein
MITIANVAAGIVCLAVGWWGGRSWIKLIFPAIREPLTLMFLPLVVTGAVLIVSLTILDRLGVPIAFWSVLAVISLNLIIPGISILTRRGKTQSTS